MGACTFMTTAKGANPREAFKAAVAEARYMHGHGGYTGTIAEKSDYVIIDLPPGRLPNDFAHELIEKADARIDSKWGPAGAIRLNADWWLFFGWASE